MINNKNILNPEHVFIDWINIREPNKGQFSELNNGRIIKIDKSGEIQFTVETTMPIVGTHDTSFRIRVTSEMLEISFNPSRYNRLENLYGLTINQVFTLINVILKSLNQPSLSKGEKHTTQKDEIFYTGAQITRLDVTINISTGSPSNLTDYIYTMSQSTIPRLTTTRKKNTVYFGKNSTYRTLKIYSKHLELIEKNLPKTNNPDYINKLATDCKNKGIARIEIKYGANFLRKNNLRATAHITHEKIVKLFMKDIQPMTKDIKQLEIDDLSNGELGSLMMYLAGIDLKTRLSHQTYYKHKKRLKEIGYDIGNNNLIRLETKPKIITLVAATPPDWYKHPKTERILKSI